jgi:hypothetical protein
MADNLFIQNIEIVSFLRELAVKYLVVLLASVTITKQDIPFKPPVST